jgi:DNA-binding transcriptional LysR family regulator
VLCETRSVLMASPAYLAARGVPTHPSELSVHDCLLYLGGGHSGNWTFAKKTNAVKGVDERVGVNIRGSLKANNSEVLRDALLAGLGIGLLPDFSLPPANAGGELPLVRVLPDWQVQGFFGDRIYALRPWSAQVPKAVQCLVEYLREYFAPGFSSTLSKG